MATESNFKDDASLAQNVSKFLNQKVYPKLNIIDQYTAHEWDRHKKEEMNGIDVDMILWSGEDCKVDEKGAFYYMQPEGKMDKGLSTFAFELGYVKKGKIKKGWFINESKVTDTYLLMWACAADRFTQPFNSSKDELRAQLKEFNPAKDFREIEFLMVPRGAMKNYLEKCGIEFAELDAFAQYVISHPSEYTQKIDFIEFERFEAARNHEMNIFDVFRNNVSFYFSKDAYAEKPVNLIIRKKFLQQKFGKAHFFVKPDAQGSWDNVEVNYLIVRDLDTVMAML